MLLMPRIHRRPIERLKSTRSIKVHQIERTKATEPQSRPAVVEQGPSSERRNNDRRQRSQTVAQDRRRGDRRNAHKQMRRELKSMLSNSGERHPATLRRDGVFVDEDV